ncbi:SPW repeat protein [Ramlibacter albus]|uniref:SPW repeat protein n=1 Tax=Ramlibacter albus TaxID=2079448 RepID=A0A923S3F0_9BURK|nr:SPW repeat protein [Ramlibacter albus]MBC5765773.1 SPW repeat protein [Ramlibacter albus]
MRHLYFKHWQDVANALLALWLVAAPWVLGFGGDSMAMSNSMVMGLFLLAASLGAVFLPLAWEEWTEALLGLWVAASPWLLGFSHLSAATLSCFITGTAVLLLALWVLGSDKDYGGWWSDRTA